jgi:hypothetical protein
VSISRQTTSHEGSHAQPSTSYIEAFQAVRSPTQEEHCCTTQSDCGTAGERTPRRRPAGMRIHSSGDKSLQPDARGWSRHLRPGAAMGNRGCSRQTRGEREGHRRRPMGTGDRPVG